MKNIITLLILIASFKIHADESLFRVDPVEDWSYTIAYNFFTFHHAVDKYDNDITGQEEDINNDNNFIGVRVNINENLGIFLGKGENSVSEDSELAGIEISQDDKRWELGSDLGIATGYEPIVSSGTIPFVNPFLRYNKPLTENSKISIKGGAMNFIAENFFLEYTFRF